VIEVSTQQMRLLHAIARQAGETHEHIRDRAAAQFDLTSLTELSSDQARVLIDTYKGIVNPPEPPQPTRFNFGTLPKRVEKKPAAETPKPVAQAVPAPPIAPQPSAASRSSGGIGQFTTGPAPKPTFHLQPKPSRAPVPSFNPDPYFKIDPELAKIPW
jgi:hypothetical protein